MRENEKLEQLLIKKAEKTEAASQLIWQKTKDWQDIQEYMNNRNEDIVLSEVQEKKLELYKFVFTQISSAKYSRTQIVTQIMKLYKRSMVQAYEDIRISKELFNPILGFNKKFELQSEIEICRNLRGQCIEACDFKNAAMFTKLIAEFISEQPDEEEAPGANFQTHKIEGVFNPRLLGAPEAIDMKEVLAALNARRKVNINIDMFEELNYKDLPDGNETTAL